MSDEPDARVNRRRRRQDRSGGLLHCRKSRLAGFELVAWQGVVAASGTPRPIVDALAVKIGKLMADPAIRDKLRAMSLEPLPPSTPDNFAASIKTEILRWAVIVKNSGVTLE